MSRSKQQWEQTLRYVAKLQELGITYDDCWSLRRISMTLHRWHEGECGDSNAYGAWCIVRGRQERTDDGQRQFVHDPDGDSYIKHHTYNHGHAPDRTSHEKIPDRERGARKRLDKIMSKYPDLTSYIQGDPRGCALHILRKADIPKDREASDVYSSRGIAVF